METTKVLKEMVLRGYQKPIVDKAVSYFGKEKDYVLAGCPNSGKTEMSIAIIMEMIIQNPNARILILAHSTTTLKKNFYDRAVSYFGDMVTTFNIGEVEFNPDAQIQVLIPQNVKYVDGKYDLIIVDEAHQNTLAKTVQTILKENSKGLNIYLTGTPSKFIRENQINDGTYEIDVIGMDMIPREYFHNVGFKLVKSAYHFGLDDYDDKDSVKRGVNFNPQNTKDTINNVIFAMVKHIYMREGIDFTGDVDAIFEAGRLFKEGLFGKTLIVCRRITQAKQVANVLKTIGIPCVISNSDTDKGSLLIEEFKNNKHQVMCVVGRAREGFDDAGIINMVDISLTHNIDLLYQMYSRVVRKNGNYDKPKLFIKVTPDAGNMPRYTMSVMSAALMLSNTEYLKKYNGDNFRTLEVRDFTLDEGERGEYTVGGSRNYNVNRELNNDMQQDVLDLFTKITEDLFSGNRAYGYTTIQEVREGLYVNETHTLESCMKSAKQYKTRSAWEGGDRKSYQSALRNGWMDECCQHMEVLFKTHTLESCIESAKQYKKRSTWEKGDYNSYRAANRNGWLDECCSHMEVLYETHTLESCLKSAKQYKARSAWQKGDANSYYAAVRNDWLDECCSHMVTLHKTHTLESCMKSAKQYKTRNTWRKGDKKSYDYAHKNGWLDECCTHMQVLFKTHTLESCMKSAKKFKTRGAWQKGDSKSYDAARRNDWLDECCQHMEVLFKKHTLESCIKVAKQYKTSGAWCEGDRNSYEAARRNGWLDECCTHMKVLRKTHTLESCLESAKKFKTSGAWCKGDRNSYDASRRNGWFDECCQHMEVLFKTHTLESCIKVAKQYKTSGAWKKGDRNSYQSARNRGWFEQIKKEVFND